ncbi:hypothetical protein [Lysinibacillus agricola]|uniref:hypothetical protein n=1 Tax=Lysinibacillus agricola TaxID=2590012 RepID=UPI003C17CC64
MFSINYKVFFDDISELKGADGYFQIQVDDEIYGLYLQDDLDSFSVSVYWWFVYFLRSIQLIKNERLVYISDIETPRVWIELKNIDDEKITIREAHADKLDGTQAIECHVHSNITYPNLSNKLVLLRDFECEVLKKAKKYLDDLKQLNDNSHPYILKFESLIAYAESQ